jgi:acetylornithine deacetylase/succinyl-diaminopimelate desuccinylase-like protein
MVENNDLEKYLITTLQTLVRIPSQSFPGGGEEEAVQGYLASSIVSLGYDVHTFEVSDVPDFRDHPLCHGPDRAYKGRKTVFTQIGPPEAEALLVLAHSDTVPIAMPDQWKFSPFSGDIAEGKVLGLGACDDKWGMAVILTLLKEIASQKHKVLSKRIVFASTIDEESGVCNGTLLLKLYGIDAACALYLDGADFQICVGNMGGSNLYLQPKSLMSKNLSDQHAEALEGSCRAYSRDRSAGFDIPYFEANMVREKTVQFRRNPEDERQFIIHFYTLPGETRQTARGWLNTLIEQALGGDREYYSASYREPWFEASFIPETPSLLPILKDETRAALHEEPTVTTISKQDGFIFNNYFNIPCISFGAAASTGEGTFHEPNEHMDIGRLKTGYEIIRNTVFRWLEDGLSSELER